MNAAECILHLDRAYRAGLPWATLFPSARGSLLALSSMLNMRRPCLSPFRPRAPCPPSLPSLAPASCQRCSRSLRLRKPQVGIRATPLGAAHPFPLTVFYSDRPRRQTHAASAYLCRGFIIRSPPWHRQSGFAPEGPIATPGPPLRSACAVRDRNWLGWPQWRALAAPTARRC